MVRSVYKGFSSHNWGSRRTFALTNIDLVKRDLMNHIFTMKGERVMMPAFGTRIPVIAFEPNDETTRAIVETDLREVFEYDPRVKLIALNVMCLPDNNMILALADLYYIEFDVQDTLRIDVPTQ
jgi:phage baseplate assembly protein W